MKFICPLNTEPDDQDSVLGEYNSGNVRIRVMIRWSSSSPTSTPHLVMSRIVIN